MTGEPQPSSVHNLVRGILIGAVGLITGGLAATTFVVRGFFGFVAALRHVTPEPAPASVLAAFALFALAGTVFGRALYTGNRHQWVALGVWVLAGAITQGAVTADFRTIGIHPADVPTMLWLGCSAGVAVCLWWITRRSVG